MSEATLYEHSRTSEQGRCKFCLLACFLRKNAMADFRNVHHSLLGGGRGAGEMVSSLVVWVARSTQNTKFNNPKVFH